MTYAKETAKLKTWQNQLSQIRQPKHKITRVLLEHLN